MKSGRFTPSAYAYAYAATTVLNAVHSGQTFLNGPPYPHGSIVAIARGVWLVLRIVVHDLRVGQGELDLRDPVA